MKTIVVVNPNKDVAGCRIRWYSIIESRQISLRYRVKSVAFAEPNSQSKLAILFLKILFKSSGLRILYHKVRLFCKCIPIACADVAIFGKPYGEHHLKAMKIAKAFNTKILSDFCDFHSDVNSAFLAAARHSDLITVPTNVLASRIIAETSKPTVVIPDKLDYSSLPVDTAIEDELRSAKPISILWFGLAFANDLPTSSFRRFCEITSDSAKLISAHGLIVEIISEAPERVSKYFGSQFDSSNVLSFNSRQWSIEAMRASLACPGFALIPYAEPVESCEKSANRIELALYAGKAVISNGSRLAGLDSRLSDFIKPMYGNIMQDKDLTFDPTIQLAQSLEARNILDHACNIINSLWEDAVDNVFVYNDLFMQPAESKQNAPLLGKSSRDEIL
jgi:hypothetical protein